MNQPPQADLMTHLDAEAGWAAAQQAEASLRELHRQNKVQRETIARYQTKISAWIKICKLMKEDLPPEQKLKQVQQFLDKGNEEPVLPQDLPQFGPGLLL